MIEPVPEVPVDAMRHLDAASARAALSSWLGLYTSCFSAAPWNEPVRSLMEYEAHVGWHFEQPGFRAAAIHGEDGIPAAVAYGWPAANAPPAHPFYRSLADALGSARMAELWAARPFELAELMVEPAVRGRGLARRLVTDLCPADGLSWLATRTDAPAAGIYLKLGWQRIANGTTSTGTPLDYMVLDLRTAGRASAIDPG